MTARFIFKASVMALLIGCWLGLAITYGLGLHRPRFDQAPREPDLPYVWQALSDPSSSASQLCRMELDIDQVWRTYCPPAYGW